MNTLKRVTFGVCCMAYTAFAEQANQEEEQQNQATIEQTDDSNKMVLAAGAVAVFGATFFLSSYLFKKEEEVEQLVDDREPEAASSSKKVANQASTSDSEVFSRMHKDLDQAGEFAKTYQGTLEFEAMIKLRTIVSKYAIKEFKPQKDALFQERIEFFKKQQWKEYAQCLQKSQVEFNEFMKQYTLEACRWIELDEQDYVNSSRELMQDPEKREQAVMIENKEQEKNEEDKPITETEELILTIVKNRAEKQAQLEMQLKAMQQRMPPQQLQAIAMLEKSKIVDEIYTKYGIKVFHLMKCVKHFNIENHPDMEKHKQEMTQRAMTAMKQQQQQQKQMNVELPVEIQEEIKEQSEKLGKGRKDENGMIEWDFYLKAKEVCEQITQKAIQEKSAEFTINRRTFLQQQKMQEYSQAVQQQEQFKMGVTMKIVQTVFVAAGFDKPATFQNSTKAFMQQQDKRDTLLKLSEKYKEEPTSEQELTKEEALENMRRIEEVKNESIVKTQRMVHSRAIPPQMMGQIMMIEKIKAFDELALEKGIEEGDLTIAFKKYDLENDSDFKNLMAEMKQRLQNQKPQQ